MKNLIKMNDGFNTVVDAAQLKTAEFHWQDGTAYHHQIKITLDDSTKVIAAYDDEYTRKTNYDRLLREAGCKDAIEEYEKWKEEYESKRRYNY